MQAIKKIDLMRASGLLYGEFSDARLEHETNEVATYSVRLEKSVRNFGRAGQRVWFPVHKKAAK